MEKSCLSCQFFLSFREDCFGDPLEPDDQGFCRNSKSYYYSNVGAGYDAVCEFHLKVGEKPLEEDDDDFL